MRRSHHNGFHKPKGRTSATAPLFDPPIEKIGKLIRLLASDVDGEALASLRALQRCLTESGTDLHHLADIIEEGWRDPAPPVVRHVRRQWWNTLADELLKFPELLLGNRELDFLHNMARSCFAPTALQEKWLGDIERRRPQQAAAS